MSDQRTTLKAVQFRRAVPHFRPEPALDRAELLGLMNQACLAPSSMNLQPWAFLIAETEDEKARLVAAAMNQGKIAEATFGIVVFGDLLAHTSHAEQVADANIRFGYLTPEKREAWIERARQGWQTEQAQRDEAFRGSMLWAMTFMLLCAERGIDATPMGGYEDAKIRETFDVPEHLVATLVLAVGQRPPDFPLKPRVERIPVEDLLLPATR
jgi:hypothetical protein